MVVVVVIVVVVTIVIVIVVAVVVAVVFANTPINQASVLLGLLRYATASLALHR